MALERDPISSYLSGTRLASQRHRDTETQRERTREKTQERETKREKETRRNKKTERKRVKVRKQKRERDRQTHRHTQTHAHTHIRTQASVRTIAHTHRSHGVLWSSVRSRDMHSSSSSPSLTMTVRVLNSRTNASSTGASESPWCVSCGNLNIMTALGGVIGQIDTISIPYVSGLNVLKSFTFSFPLRPPRPQIALFSCSTPTLSYPIPPLPFLSFFLFCSVALDFSTIFAPAPLPLVFAEVAATAVFALALRLPLEKKLNKKGKKG